MANPIENKQIANDLREVQELLKGVETNAKGITTALKESGEEASKLAKSLDLTKTQDIAKAQKLFEKLREETRKQTEAIKAQKEAKQQLDKVNKEREKTQLAVEKRLKEIEKDKEKRGLQAIKDIEKRRIAEEKAAKKAISEENKRIQAEKRAQEQAKRTEKQKEAATKRAEKQAAREKELNRAYNVQSRTLDKLRKDYKDLELQNKGNTKEARALLREIITLDNRLKKVDKTVGQSQRNVGNYASGIKGLGKQFLLTVGAITGVTAVLSLFSQAIRRGIQVTREFELTSAKLQAVSGATSEEFEKLQQQAKDLGATTQFTAANVAQLQLELSKLGFTTQQITDSTEAILQFAIATDSELGRSAEVVASTLNAFQLEASEAGRVADVAAKAFSSSALDIEKFATAIAIVAPAAQASGISIEQTTAILGKISDAGVDASTAGTALRNIFIDIADKGITLEDALNQIATSQNKLTTANELFGKRGAVVAKIVADNVDGIGDLTKVLEESEGASKAAADRIGNTLNGDLAKLQSAFEALFVEGGAFNGLLRSLVQNVTILVSGLSSLLGVSRKVVKELGSLNEQQARQLSTSQNLIESNTKLAGRYEELANKTNRTTEESEELESIKSKLLNTFDSSIARYDSETDSIIVNIEALKAKVAAEEALRDESIRNLIVSEQRLKSALAQADRAGSVFENIRGQLFEVSDAIESQVFTGVFEDIARGGLSLNEALTKTARTIQSIGSPEELRAFNRLNEAISDPLSNLGDLFRDADRARSALEFKDLKTRELKIVQKALEDVAPALQALVSEPQEIKLRVTATTEDGDEATDPLKAIELQRARELAQRKLEIERQLRADIEGVLNEQFQTDAGRQVAIQALEEQAGKDRAEAELVNLQQLSQDRRELLERDKEEVIRINNELQRALKFNDENEINRLKKKLSEKKEAIESNTDEILSIETDVEQRLTEIAQDGLDERAEAQRRADEEADKDRELANQKRLEAEQKLQEDIKTLTNESIDFAQKAFKNLSDSRIRDIDRELSGIQSQEQALRDAIASGADIGEESLSVLEDQRNATIAARNKELEKQAKLELLIATLRFGAETGNAISGIAQSQLIKSFVNNSDIDSNYEGTEDTGTVKNPLDSKGGRLSVLHDNERVVPKRINQHLKGITNDELPMLAEMYRTADYLQYDRFAPIVKVDNSSDVLVKELRETKDILRALPKQMPINRTEYDKVEKIVTDIVQLGNEKRKYHYKLRG